MARRKAQTCWFPRSFWERGGGFLASHMRSSSEAVAHRKMPVCSEAIAHAIRDVGRHRAPLPPEGGFAASERQLGSGGAPAPPGTWLCVSAGPRAPHLVPPHERLAMRPSSGRGGGTIIEVWSAGISPSCH